MPFIKSIKIKTFSIFIYYLYNYILIVAFAYAVKIFLQIHYPDYQLSEDATIFSFHGKYVIMMLSYVVSVLFSSALSYWILKKPSKKTMFWISLPYALGSLAYGVLAIYIIFFTETQNKIYFNDGLVFAILGIIIPLISIAWPSHKIYRVSAFFSFRKRHLLWIWIPLLFYLPAIMNFVFVKLIIWIDDLFNLISSFNLIEGLKEVLNLLLLAVLLKFYYKPLDYALRILNRELFSNYSALKRSVLIFLILFSGYFIAYGVHYLTSLIPI